MNYTLIPTFYSNNQATDREFTQSKANDKQKLCCSSTRKRCIITDMKKFLQHNIYLRSLGCRCLVKIRTGHNNGLVLFGN